MDNAPITVLDALVILWDPPSEDRGAAVGDATRALLAFVQAQPLDPLLAHAAAQIHNEAVLALGRSHNGDVLHADDPGRAAESFARLVWRRIERRYLATETAGGRVAAGTGVTLAGALRALRRSEDVRVHSRTIAVAKVAGCLATIQPLFQTLRESPDLADDLNARALRKLCQAAGQLLTDSDEAAWRYLRETRKNLEIDELRRITARAEARETVVVDGREIFVADTRRHIEATRPESLADPDGAVVELMVANPRRILETRQVLADLVATLNAEQQQTLRLLRDASARRGSIERLARAVGVARNTLEKRFERVRRAVAARIDTENNLERPGLGLDETQMRINLRAVLDTEYRVQKVKKGAA